MNLYTEIDISNLPILTLDQVCELTNYSKEDLESDINKSGVWRIMSGSRGYLEEIDFVGPLENNTLSIPSLEKCIANLTEGLEDEEEIKFNKEYVEEFYGIDQESHKEAILFGYTEEEFDYYVKVKV